MLWISPGVDHLTVAYRLYVSTLFYLNVEFSCFEKMRFARGTLRNVAGVWCADLGPEGTSLGCIPVPGAWLALSWMAQTWCQPESTCPTCLSVASTEVLVPGPGPPEEAGKVGGYGPVVAMLGERH